MYSFYLASKNINNITDIIVVNADCIYDDEIVNKMILNNKSCIAVDYNFFNDESMKVELNNGYIRGIAKSYKNESNVFTSIDMYKFLGKDAAKMICHVANIIDSGDKNSWTEVAIDAIVKEESVEIVPLSIDNFKWYEIDNHVDLETASKLFFNER
jgi:choline kinase